MDEKCPARGGFHGRDPSCICDDPNENRRQYPRDPAGEAEYDRRRAAERQVIVDAIDALVRCGPQIRWGAA